MSIQALIGEWVRDERLLVLGPALPSIPRVRTVIASVEVTTALMGPWRSVREEDRLGRARNLLDTFISGMVVSVRMPPSRSVKAQLALLDDALHEVWEMRARDPKPGVRIFGRFADLDCFVALTKAFREDLRNDEEWDREIERCKREWRMLFPSYPPHRGADMHAYVSNAFPV